jgi:hypothetical protein
MLRVDRRHMAVDRRRMVIHVRGRGAHVGGTWGVVHIMLSPGMRYGRLPMGHCRQMVVYHVQADSAGCLASKGAMRMTGQHLNRSMQ